LAKIQTESTKLGREEDCSGSIPDRAITCVVQDFSSFQKTCQDVSRSTTMEIYSTFANEIINKSCNYVNNSANNIVGHFTRL